MGQCVLKIKYGVYGLFNGVVSCSDYKVSNGRMIKEYILRMGVDGSGRGLI
jgi:hypothetical protein